MDLERFLKSNPDVAEALRRGEDVIKAFTEARARIIAIKRPDRHASRARFAMWRERTDRARREAAGYLPVPSAAGQ